jgi:cullin 1
VNQFADKKLSLYEEEIESLFLEETSSYYGAESQRYVTLLPIADFIEKARSRLNEEIGRIQLYLEGSSHLKVVHRFETEYIVNHMQAIQAGMKLSILEERHENCFMAYELVSRIHGGLLEPLQIFEDHVLSHITNLATSVTPDTKKDHSDYIENLTNLRKRFVTFAHVAFNKEASFEGAVDRSFRKVFQNLAINPYIQYPEAFARYCDSKLKKSGKKDEDAVETKIKNLMELFNYVDEKDLFQKFYARQLAKRLLYNTSISMEIETNSLAHLKVGMEMIMPRKYVGLNTLTKCIECLLI